ncbi:MAG: DUF61 family protein [Deltaproteobacteria bacterium]|nr:DUF61 family protein [Deltaproteobacteria bacterium]MBW2594643.1 DUF61 family protein [Deltaproteobacteria bacterium]MBW2649507.1 DUF61 family protein [Deltaproteobacteria bacterium]
MRIDNPAPDGTFENCLKDDLKTLNAHLPRKRKTLSELLEEKHPHVECGDGNTHFFKKKELEHLAGMLNNNEQRTLLLPIIIEVGSVEGGMTVRSKTGTEAKVFSKILEMPIACTSDITTIFRPQLNVLRKVLKTTTQYVFTT